MVLKGTIIYTPNKEEFAIIEGGFIIIEDDTVIGIYETLPESVEEEIVDYKDGLIIPSFIDLHIHAPQYMQRGVGLNLQLIDWLYQYTFVLESRFEQLDYAKKVYPRFVQELYLQGTLRSAIFGTIHDESNRYLVECMEKRGLGAFVGKVNMNRFAPEALLESVETSLDETRAFINDYKDHPLVKPIVTPRFAPSCSDELLDGLGKISKEEKIPVQTHLAENKREVEWVKELFPKAKNYSDIYKRSGLYGEQKTLMAHCIYLTEDEIEMAKNNHVYLVHCPNSNLNLASGIMPVTQLLDQGIRVGLGTDVGAGHEMSMTKTISAAIQCSKMRHLLDETERILAESEAFYLATKGNGRFFGEDIGSIEKGYKFDALVIRNPDPLLKTLTPLEHLERFIYCGETKHIVARYLEGKLLK